MYNNWTLVIMTLVIFCLLGVSKCSEKDRALAIQTAISNAQAGIEWLDSTIEKKCAAGKWEKEDCDYWKANKESVKEVLNVTIPYVLKKVIKTTTREEQEEAGRIVFAK